MILADSSLWIDYLRGVSSDAADALDERLAARDVLMCGPVAAELLAGEQPGERMRLWDLFTVMPWADLDRADFFSAGDAAALLRAEGRPVALYDVLIAAAAAGRATLWTRDRDFERIAEVLDSLDFKLLSD